MSDWFTVEEIDAETFAISEYKHREETHSYLLLGRRRAALIDTGLGVADIRAAVEALTAFPVSVVTTHAHWDHIGGHGLFPSAAVHRAEAGWLADRFPLPLARVREELARGCREFPEGFQIDEYQVFHGVPQFLPEDGGCLNLGGRSLTVLHTPGHSPGHCCFYEPARGYLFSGDLLYGGCLDAFYPTTDPEAFFRSVQRVRTLEVKRVLPGHHALSLPADLIDRTAEAFRSLRDRGMLRQGLGVFDFGDFQIHI